MILTILGLLKDSSPQLLGFFYSCILEYWDFYNSIIGPDRLELIIFDITGIKIDNHRIVPVMGWDAPKS